jgi:uncharacterized Zn-finger protein
MSIEFITLPMNIDIIQVNLPQYRPIKPKAMSHQVAFHFRPFECSLCPVGFVRKPDLKRHLSACHPGPDSKKYECHECGKVFYRKDTLDRHLKGVNTHRMMPYRYSNPNQKELGTQR